MSDIRERKRRDEQDRLQRELDRIHERQDRSSDRKRVQAEIDRIVERPGRPARGLERGKERLERLDRIAERDATRRLPGFDPEKARRMEDVEIEASPKAFIRRHEGGLDAETERRIRASLKERDRRE